ncbi:SMI1/KNR4 family protein [Grimontia marina]|uniref:SMI1/KNR4 family protein n=1 Tax=Grimontia marina TaxID=646534 RepID=UPI0018DC231D|nr:SMI1/KNR4 family protein [Grimontia marina]
MEQQVGVTFPRDFKEITEAYGSGAFSSFLFLINPFEEYEGYDYLSDITRITDADAELSKQTFFTQSPYPNKSGLFPLAATDNGDTIYFKPSQDIDCYDLYLYDSRRGNNEVYNMTLADFIGEWASGQLKSKILEAPDNTDFQQ